MTYKRDDEAYWLDDLEPIRGSGTKGFPQLLVLTPPGEPH
jgi:hypothetical protein